MADSNTPNQNANKSKAEGERWGVEQTSATRAADRNEIADIYHDEDGDNAGGISNRPLDEEVNNQAALTPRGMTRDDSLDPEGEPESDMDLEERRSER